MSWQEIIIGAASGAGITTLSVVAFGKGIFEKLFTQILSRDLEKFKSDLALLVKRQEITFSRLHEKRATLIAEVYAILLDVDLSVRAESAWLKNFNANATRNLGTDSDRLKEFVRLNRLYFPDSLVKTLSSILEGVDEYYSYARDFVETGDTHLGSYLESVFENIHSAQRDTEVQFKQLLGAEQ